MVDALVSVVLEQLSSIIFQEVGQEVRLVVGVYNEIRNLTSNFQAIQAVLADAEERELKDGSIKRWIDQLKGVSYDMDDVLDEWGTAIAKSQMKVNEHPRKTARKVCSFMIFSCFRFSKVGLRRDIALKIKELNERIDVIVIEKNMLNFKSSEVGIKQLEHQKNTSVWGITEAKSNLLAALWLSYHDLPSDMRQCFSYCAVFPKDFIFQRDALIKLWMAQGFLRETQNKEMEVMGHECFEALAARSFFQDFEKDEGDGSIYACKMHDKLHDFAQNLTKNECFSVDIDGFSESKIDSFSRDARHSMVVFKNYDTDPLPATIHSLKKLRSLIVDGYPSSMNAALPKLIANLSCLRTLKLSGCGIEEVPSNIGKLIHLRHVDFSKNEIRELPEEMCELFNMLTLDVSRCYLKQLPNNIGKLVKLRHLSVGDSRLVKMRGVEGLSSLRELDEFHVSGSGEESNIRDLRNLNHLQGYLKIRWLGDVKDPDEVKKAELHNKKHLTYLDLWFDSRTNRRIICDDKVLEALEPPPNIYSLTIAYYQGVIPVFPGCINKLRVVTLRKWGKIENLPPLGKLPSLEELDIGLMECVGRVGREFLGLGVDSEEGEDSIGEMTSSSSSNTIIAFPKLKSLSFQWMERWEEWEGGNEDKTNISISTIIMPSLRSLRIMGCPKLKALPNYVLQSTTLEQLAIRGSSILEEQYLKAGGEGWPNASHTSNITFN